MTLFYAFIVALLIAILTTPLMRWIACRYSILDRPGGRKVHRKSIPYLGGGGIFIGFVVAVFLFCDSPSSVLILVGASATTLLGVIDDVTIMSSKVKLLGQIVIALGTCIGGISIDYLTSPFGGTIYLGVFSWPITILWIISLMNVVNLIDGLDGLAGGVSAISAVMIAIVSVQTGQWSAAIVAIALAGASLGFLRFNFPPATIFMGDAGSMLLGYVLSVVTIVGVLKSEFVISMGIPIIALAVPILDTTFAIIRRLKKGQSIMSPDKEHFHHQLLDAGLNVKQAVILIYACTFMLGLAAIIVGYLDGVAALGFVLSVTIIATGIFKYLKRRSKHIRTLVRMISD